MHFEVRKKELEKALEIVKFSKALDNPKEEIQTSIFVECKKGSNNNIINFTAADGGFWASSSIVESETAKVQKAGSAHVDGRSFVEMISQIPEDKIIKFKLVKKDDGKDSFLESKYDMKKDKDEYELGFVLRDPQHFDEFPPQETRKSITVDVKQLREAINSVEFATSEDERKQGLWGCQVEIYKTKEGKNKIAACGTDKARMCWYDDNTDNLGEPSLIFYPIKAGFLSALKSLDPDQDVSIESGKEVRHTIIKQETQWHAVPNVVSPEDMPDWRSLTKQIKGNQKSLVKLEKDSMIHCISQAEKATGGKFGISIDIDTIGEDKKATFSLNRIESGSRIRLYMKRHLKLNESEFSGKEIKETIILSIDSLKDILRKYDGDKVIFGISGSTSPIEILCNNEKQKFKYITSVIQPLLEEEDDDDETETKKE